MADVTGKVQDTAEGATDAASGATDQTKDVANGASGTLRAQAVSAFTNAAKDILGPPIQQLSTQAAEQAANYAKQEAPRLIKEFVLPKVMDQVGADTPGDITKKGIGMVGDQIKDAGGVGGMVGKVMSKVGGGGKGKGGGQATGYGQKRRMPVQQDIMVSVNVEDAFKGWTEYSRWTEFMHRANTVDSQIEDEEEGEARVKVTEKMWGFKRPFTAIIDSQVPNEHIRWKSTEGTKHVGVIAFHPLGNRLTLISVNVDHGPAGPIEKTARGARFVKRAIRADLHRFKGWIEMKTPEDIEDIEGWLGTIENGKIVQTHEDYMAEQEEEDNNGEEQDGEGQAEAGEEDEDGEGTPQHRGRGDRSGQEGQEGDEEDGEEDQVLEDEEDDSTDDEEEEDESEEDFTDEDEDEEVEEEEDEEDEEEEEEEEKPLVAARKKKKTSAPRRKKSAARKRTRSK